MNKTTHQLLVAARGRVNLIVSLSDNEDATAALQELGMHVIDKIEELSQERQLAAARREQFA